MRRALTGQRHPAPGVASRCCTPSGAVRAPRTSRCGASNQCIVYDYSSQLVPYELAWRLQKDLVEESVRALDEEARAHAKGSTSAPSARPTHSLVILQHPPVYTLGAGSSLDHVKFDLDQPPHPIYRTERGGEVTYHGPGQLVMYPVLDLRHLRQDLHWYLRSLEEVVIAALDQVSGLAGERIPGLTGVWVDGSKVAAIGVRAKRWISYHGLALNVCPDLHPFSLITPCGIEDRPVGSVQQVLATSTQAGDDPLAADDMAGSLLLEYRYALLEAFGDVFGLELVHHDAPELLLQNQPQMDAVRH